MPNHRVGKKTSCGFGGYPLRQGSKQAEGRGDHENLRT